jgi:hypothetical protein
VKLIFILFVELCVMSFLFNIVIKGHYTYTCFESCGANLFLSFKKIKKIVQFVELPFQGLLKEYTTFPNLHQLLTSMYMKLTYTTIVCMCS